MTELLNSDPGKTSQTTINDNLSSYPSFRGNKPTEESEVSFEATEDTPSYLSDIDPVRRREIIDTSAELTRDIPGAMIYGGNANRILYEVYTGKTMFGVGKNDYDIYVPYNILESLLIKQPDGYTLEKSEKGGWIQPENDSIALIHSGEHIDVFGIDDSHESTIVELDGQTIRVQSLANQIKTMTQMMYEYDGLTKIKIDPVHNPDPISKYAVYAQKMLEVVDSEQGQAELAKHADELPEDWRETLEVMAGQGKYGEQLNPEKRDAFQERMEAWKKIQEKMKQIQDQIMNELRAYYGANHDKAPEERSGSLPSLMNGFEDKIEQSLSKASSPEDFIQTIIETMSAEERQEIRNRIKAIATVHR